jgi:hypothetical protein
LTIGAPEITPIAGTVGDMIAALLGAIAGAPRDGSHFP